MEKDFELLHEYMSWWVDRLNVTTLDTKIEIFSKQGYIEYGRTSNQLPDFETWKKIYK